MAIVMRLAKPSDLSDIIRMLVKANLNTSGVEQHLERFIVVEVQPNAATMNKRIIGTAGIERWGKDGLLRSFVMESESWNAQVGLDLIKVVMSLARNEQLECLYLMTSSSQPFFTYLGFQQVGWDQVPDDVKQSSHFESYNPENAAIMVYHFAGQAKIST
jgi:amino-acid N-acetyltransferase